LWENCKSTGGDGELFGFELSVFESVSSGKNISIPRNFVPGHGKWKSFSRHFSKSQQTAYKPLWILTKCAKFLIDITKLGKCFSLTGLAFARFPMKTKEKFLFSMYTSLILAYNHKKSCVSCNVLYNLQNSV
jgi:hypothetical protein